MSQNRLSQAPLIDISEVDENDNIFKYRARNKRVVSVDLDDNMALASLQRELKNSQDDHNLLKLRK